MIWYLTTEELMSKYTKRPIKKIERTNYLIMSSAVYKTKEHDNVLNISNMFMNAGTLKGIGFLDEPDSISAKEKFKTFLLKNPKAMAMLCAVIESTILEDEDAVILCTPTEFECGYLQVFAEVVSELFAFPVLHYPDVIAYDIENTIKRVLYYEKKIKKFFLSNGSDIDRAKFMEQMKKKELKKELKKRGLYQETMEKSDMVDLLLKQY